MTPVPIIAIAVDLIHQVIEVDLVLSHLSADLLSIGVRSTNPMNYPNRTMFSISKPQLSGFVIIAFAFSLSMVTIGCNQDRNRPSKWRAAPRMTTLPSDFKDIKPANVTSPMGTLPNRGGGQWSTLPTRGGTTLPSRGSTLPGRGSFNTLPQRSNWSTLPRRGQ